MHFGKNIRKLVKHIKRQEAQKEAWESYESILQGRAILGALMLLIYRLVLHTIGSWQVRVDEHFEGQSYED